ncbi:MAG TPA: type II toxin-antitoxin system VapC family toxin [Rhizomicrobium sp.]|jgi:ribonuclease VapC
MILDTSAVIAILRQEPEAQAFAHAIQEHPHGHISAVNYFEACIVADRDRDPVMSRRLDEFCHSASVVIVPADERHARIAREAYRDFGKGSGHPARLNFGDCFAYALATTANEPLLFKGNDFAHTDVKRAL